MKNNSKNAEGCREGSAKPHKLGVGMAVGKQQKSTQVNPSLYLFYTYDL